jgi:hypothetical protein
MTDEKRREMEEMARNGEKQPSSPRDTNPYTFVHSDDEEPAARYRRQTPDSAAGEGKARAQYIDGKRIYDVRMCSLYIQADQHLYQEVN